MVYRRLFEPNTGARSFLRRGLALLLCVLTAAQVLLVPSFASSNPSEGGILGDTAEGQTVKERTFALTVATGIVPGTTISYFGIRYEDDEGVARTYTVFPHEGSLKAGYEIASAVASPEARLAHVKDVTGYTLGTACGEQDGLAAYSVDTYLFRPYFPIEKVIGIDVFMRYAKSTENVKNEWTCSDIRLYEVEKLYGASMAGYYSDTYTIDFRGRLLADFEKKQASGGDFTVAEGDVLFRIGRETNVPYELRTYNKKNGEIYDSLSSRKTYLFRLDLADIYEGGIESLANEYSDKKAKIGKMSPVEALCMKVGYTDIFGNTRKVKIPFLTSFIAWATEYYPALNSEAVVGIAQQGDTILFEAFMPDLAELKECNFFYGVYEKKYVDENNQNVTVTNSAEAELGISAKGSRKNERFKKLKTDSLSFTGFSVFDASEAECDVWTEGAMLRCTTLGAPLFYYRSPSTSGARMESGNERNVFDDLKPVEPGSEKAVTLLPKSSSAQYVFEIVTDNVEEAGTELDITAILKYVTVDGVEKTSAPFSVKSAVSNYYGYWPGNGAEISYLAGASENGKLIFAVNYPDVDYFESIELTMNFAGKDDAWQMSSLSVYRAAALSQRGAVWADPDVSYGRYSSDRVFTRDYPKNDRLQYTEQKILLSEARNDIVITFDGSGGSSVEESEVDWESIRESMTYNETMQDLGFAKVRYTYEVAVKVFSNENASDAYGDCGSNNKFYFQLVFADGVTAYVQANQQLTSDGFRAGQTECFRISTNRDYGDLHAVRIIPDDTLNEDDIYDKINIESITITQLDLGGLSKGWKVENVGWIDIDYRDPGTQSTIRGQKLRSESEMTRNFVLDSTGFKMNFLFAISTGEYPEGYDRYEGTMTATVYYNTNNDLFEQTEIDVAEAIGIYAGKSTVFTDDEKIDTALGNKKRKQIDKTYMLRENHIDRFVVSLENVKTILGITFHLGGTVTTTWNLSNIDVYKIRTDGTLVLNSRGEYQRDGEITHLCSGTKLGGYSVPITMDARTGQPDPKNLEVNFTEHVITIDSEAWETTIDRVPAGDDDTLNIYVYFKDDVSKLKTKDLETFAVSVKYQMRDIDKPYQVKAKNLSISDEMNMLYVRGVGVKGMSILHELSLKSSQSLKVDYAIVQQIRAGVTLNTYYLPFLSQDALYNISASPAARSDIRGEEQVVSLQFADKTGEMLLGGDQNIAVMISYTNVNEQGNTVYDSAFVYLTDQNVEAIRGGKRVDLVFNENCVKEIKQISVVGLGAFDATIENALVTTYRTDASGQRNRTGQYSVAGPIPITRTRQRYPVTKTDVGDLELSFVFGETGTFLGNTSTSVSMDLNVVDSFGAPKTLHYNDLAPYLVSGKFEHGQTAVIRLLIPGITSVRSFTLLTHAAAGTADPLMFSEVHGKWTLVNSESSFSKLIGKTVKDGEALPVNLHEVEVQINAKLLNEKGEAIVNRTYKAGDVEITAVPGQTVELLCTALQSLDGFGCTVHVSSLDGANADAMLTEKNGAWIFTPEFPESGETGYVVTVTSQEDRNVSLTLHVNASAE